MYDQFWKNISENQQEKKEGVSVNLNENISINKDALLLKLKNFENMQERDIYTILKNSYSTALDSIANSKNPEYLRFTRSAKFIMVLTQVIGSVELNLFERQCCNKFVYDQLTSDSITIDSSVKNLLLTLSKVTNRKYIPLLTGIGIDENTAAYIVLSRYSAVDDFVNVKRMNFVIMTLSNSTVMTEQTIVNIYQALFDRVTVLFEATMFDVYDSNSEWVPTEEMYEVYGNIGLAVLDILESMTTQDIKKVLKSYQFDYSAYHKGMRPRFSMRSISGDYARVTDVVEMLEKEGLYIP